MVVVMVGVGGCASRQEHQSGKRQRGRSTNSAAKTVAFNSLERSLEWKAWKSKNVVLGCMHGDEKVLRVRF